MYIFNALSINYAVIDLKYFSREVKLSAWFLGFLEINFVVALARIT